MKTQILAATFSDLAPGNKNGANAIYFSRSAVPYSGDAAGITYYKHIGLYVYRRKFLLRYTDLPIGPGEVAHHGPLAELAAELLREVGDQAKLVYGNVDCRFGNLGSSSRFCFGTQIAGFDKIIQTLLALDVGACRDLSHPPDESH